LRAPHQQDFIIAKDRRADGKLGISGWVGRRQGTILKKA